VADVVLAAAAAAGLEPQNIYLSVDRRGGLREVSVSLARDDVAAGVELLAALGAVAMVGQPYGPPERLQANVEAAVPVLGGVRVCFIATKGLPVAPVQDPAPLVAGVDAARAAAADPGDAVRAVTRTPKGDS
jgi:hypothetical protein